MKRFFALALSAVMVLSLAACSSQKVANEAADPSGESSKINEVVTGGWSHSASPEVTDELRKVFDKAFEGFVGSNVTPVAYLGSQVVAGRNHCFLCQSTVVYPGAEPHYVLVYIYEGFDGSAELMNIADFDIGSLCEYGGSEASNTAEGEPSQIANPFVDYQTLADAAKAAGFELTAPETVEGYSDKLIQVMSGSMIQIIFLDSDSHRLFVRKQAGSADISGDYNEYGKVSTVAVDGRTVTLKGNDSTVSTAIWTNSGYSYAVSADVPLSADAMVALIKQIA